MKIFVAVLTLFITVAVSPVFAQAQLEEGKNLLAQGKHKEAVSVLRQFVGLYPKNVEGWYLLGNAYLKVGKLDSAETAGTKAITLDDENVNAYLLVSKVALAKKDIHKAYTTLQSALQETKNKNNLTVLLLLGEVLLQADSVDRAVVVFTQAREADPNSPATYEGLGDAYNKQGLAIAAIGQYEKAIELDSVRSDIHYKLSKTFFKERRYNEAARELQHVVALDTTNESALMELSKLYLAARPKQYGNASRFLRLYVQRFPKSNDVWPIYMESLFATRQYEDAIMAAEKVLKAVPQSADAYRVLGHSHSSLKHNDKTIEAFNHLRKVDTLKVDDLKRLAGAYLEMKKDTLVIKTYEEMLQLDSTQKDIYADVGALYMRIRKWDKAALMFEKRIMVDSTSISAFINYALCNMTMGKYDTARAALRYVTIKKPEYAPAHLYLARSLTQIDSLQSAKNSYEEFLKQDTVKNKPELAEAHRIIGVGYLLDKKYPQAIESLSESIKYKNDDWQTHLWLAQAYHFSGMKEEAIKEYQKVLKLRAHNKDAIKGLELLGIVAE